MIIVKSDFEVSRQNPVNQHQWFSNLYLWLSLICETVFNEIIIEKNEMMLTIDTLDFDFLKIFFVGVEIMFENELTMCLTSVYHFAIVFLYLAKSVICRASTWIKLFSKNRIGFPRFCKTWLFRYFMKNWISFMLKPSTAIIELINESMIVVHSTLNIISCLWIIEACAKNDSDTSS